MRDAIRSRTACLSTAGSLLHMRGVRAHLTHCTRRTALIREDGELFHGAFNRYLEMDINVHMFPYFAKKCIHMLHSRAAACALDLAMVIEGQADDELPECLLGGGRFTKIDYFAAQTRDLSALHTEAAARASLNADGTREDRSDSTANM